MFQTDLSDALTPTFDLEPLSSSTPNPLPSTDHNTSSHGNNATPSTIHGSHNSTVSSSDVLTPRDDTKSDVLALREDANTSPVVVVDTSPARSSVRFTAKPQQNTVLKKPVAVYPQHTHYFRHNQSERSSAVLSRSRSRSRSRSEEGQQLSEVKVVMEEEEILEYERVGLSMAKISGKNDESIENSDSGMEDVKNYGFSDENSQKSNTQCPEQLKPMYFSRSNNNNNDVNQDSNGNAEAAPNMRRKLVRKERYESQDTLYSSSSELFSQAGSSVSSLAQGLRQPIRASTESILSCEEDTNSLKKPGLDYDVGSSMESLGTARYSKTYGMSLYDEIQLADQLGEQYVMDDGTVVVLVEEGTHEELELERDDLEFDGNETLSNRQEENEWDKSHDQSSVSHDENSDASDSHDQAQGVLDQTLESGDHDYASPDHTNGSVDRINGSLDHTYNSRESADESYESGESHDQSEESCDESRSLDQTEESHDHTGESHDHTDESHDHTGESHDQVLQSHEHSIGSQTTSHDHTMGSHEQTVLQVEGTSDACLSPLENHSPNTSSEISIDRDEHNSSSAAINEHDQYQEFSRTSLPPQMSYANHQIPLIHQTIPETSYDDNMLDLTQVSEKQGSSSGTSEEQEVYIIMESYTMADGQMPDPQAVSQIMSEGGMVGVQTENGVQMLSYEDMAKMANSMSDVPYQIIMYEMPDEPSAPNFNGAQVIELSDSEAEIDIPKNAVRMKQPDGSEIIVIQEEDIEDSASQLAEKSAPKKLLDAVEEGLLSESLQSSQAESLKASYFDKGLEEAAAINDSIKATIKEKMGLGGASTTSESSSVDPVEQKHVVIKELTEEEAEALAAAGIPASKSTDTKHSAPDELLNLLDKIDKKAVETRTELKMAYVRETYLQGELEADEEHINNIVEDLNKEIETLRAENKKFYSEMTQHRTANKAYKLKITKLESVVDRLHNHTEELERQIFEVTQSSNQKPISVTVGSMTDKTLLMANAKSVGILTDYVQKIGPIVKDAASLVHPHQTDSLTMTDPVAQSLQREVSCQTQPDILCYDQGVQVGSGKLLKMGQTQTDAIPQKTVLDSFTETELLVADAIQQTETCQQDKTTGTDANLNLNQAERGSHQHLSNDLIDNSELLGKKPETPDKWRRLAMTPFNSDPVVLQLQRSLATATVEYDITQAKLKKNTKEATKKAEELQANLNKTQELLEKAKVGHLFSYIFQ